MKLQMIYLYSLTQLNILNNYLAIP